MLTREQIERALERPMPSGTEMSWVTTSHGYSLRLQRTLTYEIALVSDTTEEDLARHLDDARLALTSYSSEESP